MASGRGGASGGGSGMLVLAAAPPAGGQRPAFERPGEGGSKRGRADI